MLSALGGLSIRWWSLVDSVGMVSVYGTEDARGVRMTLANGRVTTVFAT